jgi:hypothetical protein
MRLTPYRVLYDGRRLPGGGRSTDGVKPHSGCFATSAIQFVTVFADMRHLLLKDASSSRVCRNSKLECAVDTDEYDNDVTLPINSTQRRDQ